MCAGARRSLVTTWTRPSFGGRGEVWADDRQRRFRIGAWSARVDPGGPGTASFGSCRTSPGLGGVASGETALLV